jgi:carboxyl-terminal processing protease
LISEEEKTRQDSIRESQKYFTLNKKRIVYGGGGITPDSLMTYDPFSALMTDLLRQRVFQDHAIEYFNKMNGSEPAWENDFEKFYREFTVTDGLVEDMVRIAKNNKIHILPELPGKKDRVKNEYYHSKEQFDKDMERIHEEIKYNIARQYFKEKTQYPRIKAMNDKFVKKALTLFEEAKKLADL